MRRFPLRTPLLMALALAAFLHLWCRTRPARPQIGPGEVIPVEVIPGRVPPDSPPPAR